MTLMREAATEAMRLAVGTVQAMAELVDAALKAGIKIERDAAAA